MRILKRDNVTGQFEEIEKYPRSDMGEIYGLDEDVTFYILEDEKPVYDQKTQKIENNGIDFLDENNSEHPALKRAIKQYITTDLPVNVIVENMNKSLGDHIDNKYPYWKQVKHTAEATRLFVEKGQGNWDEFDQLRFEYIMSKANWARSLRQERDQRELELRNNGIIPSFVWDDMPEKSEQLKQMEEV